MVNDRRYKRYFIILENEDRGFEKTDKRVPKGYAKIEVRNGKGLLNVYVQDLKYFKDAKYIYRNYLISTKGEKGLYVDTGAFMIDQKGKGELKVKFNPDNVEGSKRAIEDFNVVAVVAQPINRSSQEKEIYGPLVGYIDKQKSNWKDVLIYEENNMKMDDDLDEEYKEKYEEIINVIEKSSKELYKDDTEEADDNKEQVDNNKKEVENEENKAKDKKEYKDQKQKYYKNKETECAECIDSLGKYENETMMEEKKEEIKEEKKEQKKEEKKKDIGMEKKPEKKPEKKVQYKKGIDQKEVKEEKKEEIKVDKKIQYKKGIDQKEVKNEKKEEIKVDKKEKIGNKKEKYGKQQETKGEKKKEYVKQSAYKKPNVHYKKYHKMVYKYVKDMLKYYEKVQPFEKNIKDYQWWKIPYDKQSMHRGFLPFFGYILSIYYYNPYIYYMNNCQNLMSKYGHYIFGVAYDNDMESKYYVYGVPGRYMYKDQPFQGMTGFVYWYPIEDKKPEKGDYGYWLLHIDAKTGNVIFPMKPTIPPMY